MTLMSFESTLIDITEKLRQGSFPNEQAISQGVVLRVLRELGWDTWDTNIVWPEYKSGKGRADFALCHPASKPTILIASYQSEETDSTIRKALEHAYDAGGKFVLITSGRMWNFYLLGEQGHSEYHLIYHLDLYEQSTAEAIVALECYLQHDRVKSCEAIELARKEYQIKNSRSLSKSALRDIWMELIKNSDPRLVDLLIDAVFEKTTLRPEPSDVDEFLSDLTKPVVEQVTPKLVIPTARNAAPKSTPVRRDSTTKSAQTSAVAFRPAVPKLTTTRVLTVKQRAIIAPAVKTTAPKPPAPKPPNRGRRP